MKLRNRNVSDYQAITERNASSPFLRLPPELRLRVYELVLGGQTLHIMENFARRPRERLVLLPYLCKEPASEENIQIAFDSPDAAWNTPAAPSRHERYTTRQTLSNTAQIHFLSTQIFLNASSSSTDKYRRDIEMQSGAFISVSISAMVPVYQRLGDGPTYFVPSLTIGKAFKDYLTINLVPFCLDFELFAYQPPSESQIVSCMLQEAKMDLKVATVTIDEDPPTDWDHPDLTESDLIWTMAQKKEVSLYLRKALLCHGNIETGLAEEEA